jgi:starch synthase
VVDATPDTIADGSANGFSFPGSDGAALSEATLRALAAMDEPELWTKLQVSGMRRDFSWRHSAREYEQLYLEAIAAAADADPAQRG